MAKKTSAPHRIYREFTPEERERWKRAVAAETSPAVMAENKALGRKFKKETEATVAQLRTVFQTLREERESQGLSLADMAERTGMSREAISALENLKKPNPTINTIERYATALGKTIELRLVPTAS